MSKLSHSYFTSSSHFRGKRIKNPLPVGMGTPPPYAPTPSASQSRRLRFFDSKPPPILPAIAVTLNISESESQLRIRWWKGGSKTDDRICPLHSICCVNRAALRTPHRPAATRSNKFRGAANAARFHETISFHARGRAASAHLPGRIFISIT